MNTNDQHNVSAVTWQAYNCSSRWYRYVLSCYFSVLEYSPFTHLSQQQQQQLPLPRRRRTRCISTPFWIGVIFGGGVASFYLQATCKHYLLSVPAFEAHEILSSTVFSPALAVSPSSSRSPSYLESIWSQEWKQPYVNNKQQLIRRHARKNTTAAALASSTDDDELVTILHEIQFHGNYLASDILAAAAASSDIIGQKQLTRAVAGNSSNMYHLRSPLWIPQRLVFANIDIDIFDSKQPPVLYQNAIQTVRLYAEAFGHAQFPVLGLTTTNCEQILIPRLDSTLLDIFHQRSMEDKADFCRLVYLYHLGGYFFNQELQIVEPYVAELDAPDIFAATTVSTNVSLFVAPYEDSLMSFFQNFLAVTPRHPVLAKCLELVRQTPLMSIKAAIWEAYHQTMTNPSTVKSVSQPVAHFLYEAQLADVQSKLLSIAGTANIEQHVAPQNGSGCCCNFVVYGNQTLQSTLVQSIAIPNKVSLLRPHLKIYFMSRVVGASNFCTKLRMLVLTR